MIIANNATNKFYLTNYQSQNSKLQTSLTRLSTGSQMVTPGEAPADLGISERFRAQVKNSEAAGRVIQNAINLFQTSDSYLQEVHNILNRMSELSIAASDGSKSPEDRENLDLEFQQLKSEIARISDSGKYNGVQINSRTSVAAYNTHTHKIEFSQADGDDVQALDINLLDGTSASNNVQYAFESSSNGGTIGDFVFTQDGKSLIYVAQKSVGSLSARQTLMKLDLESNTLTTAQMTSAGGASATTQARIFQDSEGRVWISDPSTATNSAVKNFNIKLLDVDAMTLDAGGSGVTNKWAGGVSLASSFSNFAVNDDSIFFIERSGGSGQLRLSKQNIFDRTNKEILLTDLSGSTYNLDAGESYIISNDGQYLAFEDEDNANAGTLVVINTSSGEKASLQLGTRTTSIVGLQFDSNNNIYWTDTGTVSDENVIKRASIVWGDEPSITNIQTIRNGKAGTVGAYSSGHAGNNMGLSVSTGSPAATFLFQVGAESGMDVKFDAADVSLVTLGISELQVTTQEDGNSAVSRLARAIDKVAQVRATLGSQVSRLNFAYSANQGYGNNLAAAESRIRDVDIAKETSNLAQAQIMAQTGISVMAQFNTARQNVLRLLQ